MLGQSSSMQRWRQLMSDARAAGGAAAPCTAVQVKVSVQGQLAQLAQTAAAQQMHQMAGYGSSQCASVAELPLRQRGAACCTP